jgi:DNA-binding transcriptional LysR family regulator
MINLYYLKYFYDAGESQSIAQAAMINHVSSSAISQAIKWLENFYQIKLINHGKNKFSLTLQGLEVMKMAKEQLKIAHQFNQNLSHLSNPKYQIIKISMQQSIANTIMAKVIKKFSENNPDVKFEIRIGTSPSCRDFLLSGKVPYSISIDNVDFKSPYERIYSGEFVFISEKNDKRKPEEAGFVLTEDTAEVIKLKNDYYNKFQKKIPLNYSISSWGVIANMAINGNGIAYIPDYYLKELNKDKYQIRKINIEKSKYNINLYYLNKSVLTHTYRQLLDVLIKQFNSR